VTLHAHCDIDDGLAGRVPPRFVMVESEPWIFTTTANNLEMVWKLRRGHEPTQTLERAIAELRKRGVKARLSMATGGAPFAARCPAPPLRDDPVYPSGRYGCAAAKPVS
jgi:hypothetical protein